MRTSCCVVVDSNSSDGSTSGPDYLAERISKSRLLKAESEANQDLQKSTSGAPGPRSGQKTAVTQGLIIKWTLHTQVQRV
jgi:hypothetical protein